MHKLAWHAMYTFPYLPRPHQSMRTQIDLPQAVFGEQKVHAFLCSSAKLFAMPFFFFSFLFLRKPLLPQKKQSLPLTPCFFWRGTSCDCFGNRQVVKSCRISPRPYDFQITHSWRVRGHTIFRPCEFAPNSHRVRPALVCALNKLTDQSCTDISQHSLVYISQAVKFK